MAAASTTANNGAPKSAISTTKAMPAQITVLPSVAARWRGGDSATP